MSEGELISLPLDDDEDCDDCEEQVEDLSGTELSGLVIWRFGSDSLVVDADRSGLQSSS